MVTKCRRASETAEEQQTQKHNSKSDVVGRAAGQRRYRVLSSLLLPQCFLFFSDRSSSSCNFLDCSCSYSNLLNVSRASVISSSFCSILRNTSSCRFARPFILLSS